MAQRRFHYEQAFEAYLRANQVPYVAVDEAKKALMRDRGDAPPTNPDPAPRNQPGEGKGGSGGVGVGLKSFDFVVYGGGRNLLIDVKGRKYGRATSSGLSNARFENWVTNDDLAGLTRWRGLFGGAFEAIFVFIYCLEAQPPDALFAEVFAFGNRWYVLREVELEAYRAEMRPRSEKWGTVSVPRAVFDRISRPFSIREAAVSPHSCGPAGPGVSFRA